MDYLFQATLRSMKSVILKKIKRYDKFYLIGCIKGLCNIICNK